MPCLSKQPMRRWILPAATATDPHPESKCNSNPIGSLSGRFLGARECSGLQAHHQVGCPKAKSPGCYGHISLGTRASRLMSALLPCQTRPQHLAESMSGAFSTYLLNQLYSGGFQFLSFQATLEELVVWQFRTGKEDTIPQKEPPGENEQVNKQSDRAQD